MVRAHDSLIVQTIGRLLIPLIQLFGIYVLCFGQFGPGGGFVGGVIIGTSLVLTLLIFGLGVPGRPRRRGRLVGLCRSRGVVFDRRR